MIILWQFSSHNFLKQYLHFIIKTRFNAFIRIIQISEGEGCSPTHNIHLFLKPLDMRQESKTLVTSSSPVARFQDPCVSCLHQIGDALTQRFILSLAQAKTKVFACLGELLQLPIRSSHWPKRGPI